MSPTAVLVLMGIGTVPGYIVGVWSAEARRALADGRGAWKRRNDYRK